MVELRDSYKRRYKLRAVGQDGLNIVVSIPRVVIEREAERRGLTVGKFLEQFNAVAQYDNFEGVRYTFEEVTEGKPSDKLKERSQHEAAPQRHRNKINKEEE